MNLLFFLIISSSVFSRLIHYYSTNSTVQASEKKRIRPRNKKSLLDRNSKELLLHQRGFYYLTIDTEPMNDLVVKRVFLYLEKYICERVFNHVFFLYKFYIFFRCFIWQIKTQGELAPLKYLQVCNVISSI